MRRRQAALCTVPIVLAVLIGTILLAQPAAASPGAWVAIPSEHVRGDYDRAYAVVAPAADDVWALGYQLTYVGGAPVFRTFAQHYDGFHFATVPIPDRDTGRDFLNGAAAVSSDDIWAVGSSIISPSQTLIEHWDGQSWTLVDSPNPGSVGDELQAVAATSATDAWAVGARINSGQFYQRPLTLHWDGVTWQPVHAPNPRGCTGHSYLTGVASVGPGSVWATGWCGSGGNTPEFGFVLHWDGTTWSLVRRLRNGVAAETETYGIAASNDSSVWVVGYYRGSGSAPDGALTYHYTGTRWRQAITPSSAITLAGVTMGPGGVWTVGAGTSPQPPFAGPCAARRTSAGWVDRPLPVDYGRLNAVTTAPDGTVWAVGSEILDNGDDGALIVRRA